MKILQLCKKVPFPLQDGESIAVHALAESYATLGHQVDLLCMNTRRHQRDMTEAKVALPHYRKIYGVQVDNRITIIGLIKNLFDPLPYHVSRIKKDDFRLALIKLLQSNEYDIVQVETVFPMIYVNSIRTHSQARLLLRPHNVEHLIWQRLSENSPWYKKWYLQIQAKKIARFERMYISHCDLLLPVSEDDLSKFQNEEAGEDQKHFIVPIGLDLDDYVNKHYQSPESDRLVLGFIGTLDWMPNIEGLLWFLNNVWPDVITNFSSRVHLKIAGKSIPKSISSRLSSQVEICGFVPDAKDFIRSCDAMIVPLLAGSGQRVKILEAMALGVPVIATSIGAEGINIKNGKHILIADKKDEFLQSLADILSGKTDILSLAAQARQFIADHHDAYKIGHQLLESIFTK